MTAPPPEAILTDVPIEPDAAKELKGVVWIEHRVLTIIPEVDAKGAPTGNLKFAVNEPPGEPRRANPYEYVPKILDYTIPRDGAMTDRQWNIELPVCQEGVQENEPRILIMQLDNAIDWEFSPGSAAVTAKVEEWPQDPLENCSLYFVNRKGEWTLPGEPAPQDCRLVYWSILARPKNAVGYYARRFSFFIDFIDSDTGQRMRTIFDPSIPDQGGGSIP